MAYLIPADDNLPIKLVTPANGTDFTSDELYALIGCETFEMVPWRVEVERECNKASPLLDMLFHICRIGSVFGDVIATGKYDSLWIDEEGKLNGAPYNARATMLFQARYGEYDVIVGNALLIRPGEVL